MEVIQAALELDDPVAALEATIEASCAIWESSAFIHEQLQAIVTLEPDASALVDRQRKEQRADLLTLARRLSRAGHSAPASAKREPPPRCTCSPASSPSSRCAATTASPCARHKRRSPSWRARYSRAQRLPSARREDSPSALIEARPPWVRARGTVTRWRRSAGGHETALLLIAAVQFGDQCAAEIEELLRDRLVPAEIERPDLEGMQQGRALAGAELDRLGCADSAEACSDLRVGLDVLEPSHQRLAGRPAEDNGAPVERDGDAVETHRHGGDGRRTGQRRLGPK